MAAPTTTVEVCFDETPVLAAGDVTRTNLVTNPNFETNTTGWGAASGATNTRTSAQSVFGSWSISQTRTSTTGNLSVQTSPRLSVAASTTYTISGYFRRDYSTTRTTQIRVIWYDANSTIIGTTISTAITPPAINTWGRFSATVTAPANAATIFFDFFVSSAIVGETIFVDGVLLEASSSLLPYFDGTYADTYTNYALLRQGWDSTVDGSTSTAYWASTSTTNIAFTLDDTTEGILNNPYYLLDGALAFSDVSADVQQVTVNRGRSRQLDEYQAGIASISFYNKTRKYDPLNTASAYYPYVIPRRYVRIKSNGLPVFAGLINNWSLNYEQPQDSYVTASCSDAFAILANQNLNTFTPDVELSGSRITTALNRPEINFVGTSVSIDAGGSTMGAFTVPDNEGVLGYLRQVEKSEQGYLFCSNDNTLKFKGRASVVSQTGGVAFADDGTGTSSYMTLEVETGDDLLFNRIVAQSPAGVAQIVSDTTSIATYDTSTLEATDLLNSDTNEVLSIANLLLQQYKTPEVRYTGLSQQLAGLSTTNQNLLLGLDLTDLATVKRTYAYGSPASVTQYLLVEGIQHTITPANHIIQYRFAALSQAGFVLDSGTFGLLDVGQLT